MSQRYFGDPTGCKSCTNIGDNRLGKLGPAIVYSVSSLAVGTSVLSGHITRVVSNGAKKQMGRIDTTAVGDIARGTLRVTPMADLQPVGYRTVDEFPCYAGSHQRLAIETANAETTIPMTRSGRPHPAIAGFIYFCPKALFEVQAGTASQVFPLALVAAISGGGRMGSLDCIGIPTMKANHFNPRGGHCRMGAHRKFTPFGVMPSAVSAARGLLLTIIPERAHYVQNSDETGADARVV